MAKKTDTIEKKKPPGGKSGYSILVNMSEEEEDILTRKAGVLGVSKTKFILMAMRAVDAGALKALIEKQFENLAKK